MCKPEDRVSLLSLSLFCGGGGSIEQDVEPAPSRLGWLTDCRDWPISSTVWGSELCCSGVVCNVVWGIKLRSSCLDEDHFTNLCPLAQSSLLVGP